MKILQRSRRGNRRGFSLAELMVVIVIIGLLATLVVPNVIRALSKGQTGKMKSDISQLSSAVDNFYIDNSRYPQSLEELVGEGGGQSYIKGSKVPTDPWKVPYMFEPPLPGQQEYRIYSLGRDGAPGGENEDADYDSTMLQD